VAFGSPTSFPVGFEPVAFTAAFLNADNVLDLAVAFCATGRLAQGATPARRPAGTISPGDATNAQATCSIRSPGWSGAPS
jgi:hypothetical protein